MTITPVCHTSSEFQSQLPSSSNVSAQAAHMPAGNPNFAGPLERKLWWSTCGWLLAGLYGGSTIGLAIHSIVGVLPILWIMFGPILGATLAVGSQLAGRRFPLIVTLGAQLVHILSLFMVGLYLLVHLL